MLLRKSTSTTLAGPVSGIPDRHICEEAHSSLTNCCLTDSASPFSECEQLIQNLLSDEILQVYMLLRKDCVPMKQPLIEKIKSLKMHLKNSLPNFWALWHNSLWCWMFTCWTIWLSWGHLAWGVRTIWLSRSPLAWWLRSLLYIINPGKESKFQTQNIVSRVSHDGT